MPQTLKKLISIVSEISEIDESSLSSSTDYVNSDFYDSLFTLSLIASVDEIFNIVLSGSEVQNTTSLEALSDLIDSKLT